MSKKKKSKLKDIFGDVWDGDINFDGKHDWKDAVDLASFFPIGRAVKIGKVGFTAINAGRAAKAAKTARVAKAAKSAKAFSLAKAARVGNTGRAAKAAKASKASEVGKDLVHIPRNEPNWIFGGRGTDLVRRSGSSVARRGEQTGKALVPRTIEGTVIPKAAKASSKIPKSMRGSKAATTAAAAAAASSIPSFMRGWSKKLGAGILAGIGGSLYLRSKMGDDEKKPKPKTNFNNTTPEESSASNSLPNSRVMSYPEYIVPSQPDYSAIFDPAVYDKQIADVRRRLDAQNALLGDARNRTFDQGDTLQQQGEQTRQAMYDDILEANDAAKAYVESQGLDSADFTKSANTNEDTARMIANSAAASGRALANEVIQRAANTYDTGVAQNKINSDADISAINAASNDERVRLGMAGADAKQQERMQAQQANMNRDAALFDEQQKQAADARAANLAMGQLGAEADSAASDNPLSSVPEELQYEVYGAAQDYVYMLTEAADPKNGGVKHIGNKEIEEIMQSRGIPPQYAPLILQIAQKIK